MGDSRGRLDVAARDEIWEISWPSASARGRPQHHYITSGGLRSLSIRRRRIVAIARRPRSARAFRSALPPWGDDDRAIARAARALPYVSAARATGAFARIEVARARTPGAARVIADLVGLHDGAVRFAEHAAVDMETTLLALSSAHAAGLSSDAPSETA